ncbi:MAG: GMC family oxidoreductase [Pseudomonadota bacterium]
MFKKYPTLAQAEARTTDEVIARSGQFDAIVVGAGASGGLAARLLCEAGLQTLVIDAGWTPPVTRAPLRRATSGLVSTLANPAALRVLPPRVIYKGRQALKALGKVRQPVQTNCYAWERDPAAFVDDIDNPYETPEDKPYAWLRTHAVGGRVRVPGHGRQYYRFAEREFAPEDGLSPPWPFAPGELDPWYGRVEPWLDLAGARDGIDSVPDSEISRPLCLTEAEEDLKTAVIGRFNRARVTAGRYAAPMESLGAASITGNLWCRRGAVARQILSDSDGNAAGVSWIEPRTKAVREARAPIVFVCASPLESTRLLMLSGSSRAPDGLGARSGVLGKNLMDHVLVKVEGIGGKLAGDPEPPEDGRCLFLPRFDRAMEGDTFGHRGYGIQLYQTPGDGARSWFTAVAFGEMTPRADNHIRLHPTRKNAIGLPILHIESSLSARERTLAASMGKALRELADVAGAELSAKGEAPATPGISAHECGTARMGSAPDTSVLDPHNQCWDMPGLYLTDASSFPSQGFQNPTLTVLALTARAVDYAVRECGGSGVAQESEAPVRV